MYIYMCMCIGASVGPSPRGLRLPHAPHHRRGKIVYCTVLIHAYILTYIH